MTPELAQELETILGVNILQNAKITPQQFAIYIPQKGQTNAPHENFQIGHWNKS